MKCDIILTICAILIAALLGYWAFDIASADENAVICGMGSFLSFGLTLVSALGLRCPSSRGNINLRLLSVIAFILLAISNFSFAFLRVKMPLYIVINGILLLCFLISYYCILKIYKDQL